jgi:hypothetical protein
VLVFREGEDDCDLVSLLIGDVLFSGAHECSFFSVCFPVMI